MRKPQRLLPATLLLFACDGGPAAEAPGAVQMDPVTAAPAAACPDRSALRNPYFGDLHVHTSYSFDAYIFETRNRPQRGVRLRPGG